MACRQTAIQRGICLASALGEGGTGPDRLDGAGE